MKFCDSDTLDVIYEDNHLLVINKPAGLLSQPTPHFDRSAETLAKAWVKEKYSKPGNVFLTPIHRLDRVASGILIFAKTQKALSRLNQALREKQIHKIYWAIVEGIPPDKGTFEDKLVHGENKALISEEGKLARLHYHVVQKGKGIAFLEIELETGRYHQIRIQCSSRGYPILGDALYGSQDRCPEIFLHHYKCTLMHPTTGERIGLVASTPSYWQTKALEFHP